ncbi:MAG: hypothetical protein ACE15D_05075 [Candidatus Eisenbacteria bacterium]|nr:hypothetical protein [Candidatus Eisenbacteria bacterium]
MKPDHRERGRTAPIALVFVLCAVAAVAASLLSPADCSARRFLEVVEFGPLPDTLSVTRPFLSIRYGEAAVDRKDLAYDLAANGTAEVQAGYVKLTPVEPDTMLIRWNFDGVRVGLGSSDAALESPESGEAESKMWRFGFVDRVALAYTLGTGRSALVPYSGTGIGWTRFELDPPREDDVRLRAFDGSYRFGSSWEGGVTAFPSDKVAIEVSYQRSIVFPRHLFWKWLGSAGIERAAQAGVDEFVDAVANGSPGAAPIVGFFLKNAIGYGLYELRKSDMNWPFDTAPPLTYDAIQAGFSFSF